MCRAGSFSSGRTYDRKPLLAVGGAPNHGDQQQQGQLRAAYLCSAVAALAVVAAFYLILKFFGVPDALDPRLSRILPVIIVTLATFCLVTRPVDYSVETSVIESLNSLPDRSIPSGYHVAASLMTRSFCSDLVQAVAI